MPGTLTIDADGVRAVANALGSIDSQIKSDAEQLSGQLSALDAALNYADIGANTQLRQAINILNQIAPLLQTAQTRLMQVVTDTLHMEHDIETGTGGGTAPPGSVSPGGNPSQNQGGGGGGWRVQTNQFSVQQGGLTGKLNGDDKGQGTTTMIGVNYTGVDAQLGGSSSDPGSYGNIDLQAGAVSSGAGVQLGGKDPTKWRAGVFANATTASATASGRWGSQDLGATGSIQVAGPSGDVFAGVENGSIGADIGGSLISAQGTAGVDIAGTNVGVTGGIGLQWHLGFSLGEKTEVKLGPFELGFSFGGAK